MRPYHALLVLCSLLPPVFAESDDGLLPHPPVVMRSNLYFGAKAAKPKSWLAGVGWLGGGNVHAFRFQASDHDQLQDWGWKEHDGSSYGFQHILDLENQLELNTTFLRHEGSQWVGRIQGQIVGSPPVDSASLFFVLTSEGGRILSVTQGEDVTKGFVEAPLFMARDENDKVEGFFVVLKSKDSEKPSHSWSQMNYRRKVSLPSDPALDNTHFIIANAPVEAFTQVTRVVKGYVQEGLRTAAKRKKVGLKRAKENHITGSDEGEWRASDEVIGVLPNLAEDNSNLVVLQQVLGSKFEVDLIFVPAIEGQEDTTWGGYTDPYSIFAQAESIRRETLGFWAARHTHWAQQFSRKFLTESNDTQSALSPPGISCTKPDECTSELVDESSSPQEFVFPAAFELDAVALESWVKANARPLSTTIKAAVSNLIGSYTYFYGSSLVGDGEQAMSDSSQVGQDTGAEESEPYSLYTGVPSRSFFPRGFLWDEGFHTLVSAAWNPQMARASINSWFATMNEQGWIPREQILGFESRAAVPPEFRIQRRMIGNPPTMYPSVRSLTRSLLDLARYPAALEQASSILTPSAEVDVTASGETASSSTAPIDAYVVVAPEGGILRAEPGLLSEEEEAAVLEEHPGSTVVRVTTEDLENSEFLSQTYPLLELHYKWLRESQSSESLDQDTFRWTGTTAEHCLSSGLDDYPRSMSPSRSDEHVDLLSWMTIAARVLRDLAPAVGESGQQYNADLQRYRARLERHWNSTLRMFCDIGHREDGSRGHVCHEGYVSLFPLLARMLGPNDPRHADYLAALTDSNRMWSEFGLRSLSKSDRYYGKNENYWRGKVWYNVNYMALSAFNAYANSESPFAAAYAKLRDTLRLALLKTATEGYMKQGYVFENYESDTGKGTGTKPFTGWTALISLIQARRYVEF